ncbi:hypothetical protein V6N13_106449 [Hibiscus sabdariffa]
MGYLFPASLVFHLDWVGSDHCPLFLYYPRQARDRQGRPSHFIATWQDHHEFEEFLQNTWDMTVDVESNVSLFAEKARQWNDYVFGLIGVLRIGVRENYISALRKADGNWCSDQSQLKNMVVHFYWDLFTSCGNLDLSSSTRGQFKQCTSDMSRVLLASVLDEEAMDAP